MPPIHRANEQNTHKIVTLGDMMSLNKFINGVIAGLFTVRVKQSGDNYIKRSHNTIKANKPIKKDWSK